MSEDQTHSPLPGSEPPADLASVATDRPVDLEAAHKVTVVLRPRDERALNAHLDDGASLLPHQRPQLSAADRADLHSADQADLSALEQFAAEAGVEVIEADLAHRTVVLEGRLGDLCRAFRVDCVYHSHDRGESLFHSGPVHVPRALADRIVAVLGFDQRPLAGPRAAASSASSPYDPRDIGSVYDFPEQSGKGERIAIILLGGGFHQPDLDAYFEKLGMTQPSIEVVGVSGAVNDPAEPEAIQAALESGGLVRETIQGWTDEDDPSHAADASGDVKWTIEATLDVELVGALAPAAEIVVYFAPGNIQGKVQAFKQALSADPPVSVICCSWGGFQRSYRQQDVDAMESLFTTAAAKGVTLCFASGDYGDGTSAYGTEWTEPEVLYPAASPWVLACGGTVLDPNGSDSDEVVWREELSGHLMGSGGGVATSFGTQKWQASAAVEDKTGSDGRGLPDVASKADILNGYLFVAGGADASMGGTSAAAPLWAALVARLNEGLRQNSSQPVGRLSPLLYRDDVRTTFRDIVSGNNGTYEAGKGWDACTGWGSPLGKALLKSLSLVD